MLLGHDTEPAVDVGIDPDGLQALIREARRRAWVRRVRRVTGVALVGAVSTMVYLAVSGSGRVVVLETASRPFVNVSAFAGEADLAFVSRGRVWVLDGRAGVLRRLPVPAGDRAWAPSFSHDGRWLAYRVSRGDPEQASDFALWLARGDGTHAHPFTRLRVDWFVAWSPTADVLAATVGSSNYGPFGAPTAVELISPNGAQRPLFRLTGSQGRRIGAIDTAAWSPDGRAVAISTEGRSETIIRSVPIANPARQTIWFAIPNKRVLSGVCSGSCVSNEVVAYLAGWWRGWGIGFWAICCGASRNLDSTPIELVPAPGAPPRIIARTLSDGVTDAVAAGGNGTLAVVASGVGPGREIGVGKTVERCDQRTRSCTALPGASIWTASKTGACATCSTGQPRMDDSPGVSLDPAVSPDGRLLAYIKAPQAGTLGWPALGWYRDHALYVLDIRTGKTQQIGPIDGAQLPTWSRNGRRLLFVANDGLWLTSLRGGRPVEVEHPLFPERAWNSLFNGAAFADDFYGQIPWSAQFSWSSP